MRMIRFSLATPVRDPGQGLRLAVSPLSRRGRRHPARRRA